MRLKSSAESRGFVRRVVVSPFHLGGRWKFCFACVVWLCLVWLGVGVVVFCLGLSLTLSISS